MCGSRSARAISVPIDRTESERDEIRFDWWHRRSTSPIGRGRFAQANRVRVSACRENSSFSPGLLRNPTFSTGRGEPSVWSHRFNPQFIQL